MIYICRNADIDVPFERAHFPPMQHVDETTPPTLDDILKLEKQVWQTLVDGDADADRALLSADFLGVYTSGFAGRDEHVDQFADAPTMQRYELSDPRLRVLTPDIVLLSYRADYQRPGTELWEAMMVSSLWERREDAWINSFSQDTPLESK